MLQNDSSADECVPMSPGELKFDWQALASSVLARRAYRRYYGTHKSTYRFENWGTVLLLLLLWGFVELYAGLVAKRIPETAGPDGLLIDGSTSEELKEESGIVVTFVWAYAGDTSLTGVIIVGALYIILAYLLISYQRALQLRGAAWVTIVTCIIMLALALTAGLQNEFSDKLIQTRTNVVFIWIIIQMFLLVFGLFQKRMLPWLHQSGNFLTWKLTTSTLEMGAKSPSGDLWEKLPGMYDRFLQEYNATPIYTFHGDYLQFGDRWLMAVGMVRGERLTYVGGLDETGAPHGMAVVNDTSSKGELFIGQFSHGKPVAPFRTRTHSGSGFAAFRVAVFSCRTDDLRSNGSLDGVIGSHSVDGGSRPAQLQFGVASVECNTSGLFFKGFPRVFWLQKPEPVEELIEESQPSGSFLVVALEPEPPRHVPVARPEPMPTRTQAALMTRASSCPVLPGEAVDLMTASPDQVAGQDMEANPLFDTAEPAQAQDVPIKPLEDTSTATQATVGSAGQRGRGEMPSSSSMRSQGCRLAATGGSVRSLRKLKKWESNKGVWDRKVVHTASSHSSSVPSGHTRPSTWLNRPSSTMFFVGTGEPQVHRARSIEAFDEEESGYEALLFVQGFNSSVEAAMKLVAQLLALGNLPTHIKPVVFAWPCTSGALYLAGHKVVLSDYVATKFEETLEKLHEDGCRRLHIIGHSMGSRIVSACAGRLERLFPRSSDRRAEPRASQQPPKYGPGVMDLASVTFLSPDLSFGDFAARSGPRLRAICPLITIYGDTNDDALHYSILANNWYFRMMPRHAPAGLKEDCEQLSIPIGTSLGTHCNTIMKMDGTPLDVDFVCTTFLDTNVHAMRHNYFHLNREMVDDLRDVVVTGRRAFQRSYRLEWDRLNTYGFILAPSYVVAEG